MRVPHEPRTDPDFATEWEASVGRRVPEQLRLRCERTDSKDRGLQFDDLGPSMSTSRQRFEDPVGPGVVHQTQLSLRLRQRRSKCLQGWT